MPQKPYHPAWWWYLFVLALSLNIGAHFAMSFASGLWTALYTAAGFAVGYVWRGWW
jgi:hypothetical protein